MSKEPSPAVEPLRLAQLRPAPESFWIRHAPRAWPLPDLPLLDLARGTVWETATEVELAWEPALDDLLYMPPVPAELRPARDRLAALHLARGTPVLVQLVPGEPPPPAAAEVVYDLLPGLLSGQLPAGRFPGARQLPAGSAAAWPLIPGLTDDPELWEQGCRRLAEAGVTTLQGVVPRLDPGLRRRLAAGRGEEVFHALFHRPSPSARELARVARRHGLAPFLPRPLPRPPLTGAGNRRLVGELALAAELWLSLERPVGRGLALARAARWIDQTPYDVEALAREGNLGVVAEIDPETRQLIAARLVTTSLPLLAELLAEYGAAGGGAVAEPEGEEPGAEPMENGDD